MGKRSYLDTDLTGTLIDQRAKDGKSVEVNGDRRFCGHRYLLKQKLFGDKKCLYCGRWFHWKQADKDIWINEGNIDNLNADNVIEPLHCGSEHCQEYHHLSLEAKSLRLFKSLQQRKIIV